MTPSTLLNLAGRAVLGWFFVQSGVRVFLHPEQPAKLVQPALAAVRERLPEVPVDDVTLVRTNAAVHLVAGALLLAPVTSRPAALVLAGSMIPTTVAGHPWWNERDPGVRMMQRMAFDKNAAVFGALLALATGARR